MGQGALGIETHRDDFIAQGMISSLDDKFTHSAVNSERGLVGALDGGCQVPIGSYATVDNNLITLRGLVASLDGKTVYKLIKTGPIDDAINIGHALGVELLSMGADKVLKSLSQ